MRMRLETIHLRGRCVWEIRGDLALNITMKSFNDQLTITHCWHIATQEQKIRLTTFNMETLLQQTSVYLQKLEVKSD